MRAGGFETRVAVLASGNGSNLQALLDTVQGRYGVEIVRVVSDKPGAYALERAAEFQVPTSVFALDAYDHRAARDDAIIELLRDEQIDLVVLAGYMAILSPEFINAFFGRIINVHPSLLPAFPGLDAIGQALAAGASETGVTVHYVDEGVDTGPVIAQETLAISPGETREALEERIHALEHRLLPEVVAQIAQARAGT